MKLAFITPDGVGHCLLCRCEMKQPTHRRLGNGPKEETPVDVKVKMAEQDVAAHLFKSHARSMLEKKEVQTSGGVKLEYHGRADYRCWGPMRRF